MEKTPYLTANKVFSSNSKYNTSEPEDAHKTYILSMAKYHRIEKLYNLGKISKSEYISEKGKLYREIQNIVEKIEKANRK